MQKRIKVCGNLIHHTAPFSMTLNDPYAEKHGGALCRVKIHRKKQDLRYVNGNGKVIVDPHRAPDEHQILTSSRGSPFAHAYCVWWTSVVAIVSYPVQRQTERITERTITLLPQLCPCRTETRVTISWWWNTDLHTACSRIDTRKRLPNFSLERPAEFGGNWMGTGNGRGRKGPTRPLLAACTKCNSTLITKIIRHRQIFIFSQLTYFVQVLALRNRRDLNIMNLAVNCWFFQCGNTDILKYKNATILF